MTSATPRVVLAGATGLIGQAVVAAFARDATHGSLLCLARRVPPQAPAWGAWRQVAWERLTVNDLHMAEGPPTVALCALGTTMKAAGSRDAFRHVDHDLVVAFARTAHAAGATTFIVVSSAGAAPGARSFYLRVKGEMEASLREIPFASTYVVRPGLLLGERTEKRTGEALATRVLPLFNPLLRGRLAAFRAIDAAAVARAMLAAARQARPGFHVIDNRDGALEAAAF